MIDIPGYKVKAEIGSGGMATAYLAVQESLDREVALKVMAPALAADRSFSQRFLREARTIASLNHPNIVQIYEIAVTDDQLHYFSMQHLPGGDFAARIRAGVSEADLVRILKGVADALSFAHAQGFVHRDVTPGNILFDASGTPVLTDFGIARAVTQATRITGTGMSVGTSHYMSPEQARGGAVDGRSDIYSLGSLTYEALTGETPFDGSDGFAVAYSHVFDPIPELPDVHYHWQTLIDRAMAKDANERFPDAQSFVAELERIESGQARRELDAAGGPDAVRAASGVSTLAVPASLRLWRRVWRWPLLKRVPRARRSLVAVTIPFLLIAVTGILFSMQGDDGEIEPDARPTVAPTLSQDSEAEVEAEREPPPEPVAEEATAPPSDDLVMLDVDTGERVSVSPREPMSTGEAEADDSILISERESMRSAFTPTPIGARGNEISRLLAAAADDLAARRLTTPAGESAFDRYRQVLELEADNADAVAGLSRIVDNYLVLAESDLAAGRYPRLRTFLRRARTVVAADPTLQPKIRRINRFAEQAHAQAMRQGREAMSVGRARAAAELFQHALALSPASDEARSALVQARDFVTERVQDRLADGAPGPEMIRLPAGRVRLGGPDGVDVGIGEPFAIGAHEVSLAAFRRFVDASGHFRNGADIPRCRVEERGGLQFRRRNWDAPGFAQGEDHPVVCITWADAQAYARWLSAETGASYRLPSEAEWEYAMDRFGRIVGAETRCDADNLGDASLGQKFDRRARESCDDGYVRTAPVEAFPTSAAGLHSMLGNVREWTLDCAHDNHAGRPDDRRARLDGNCERRMVKGASWWSTPAEVSPSAREPMQADQSFGTVGFRLVRSLD